MKTLKSRWISKQVDKPLTVDKKIDCRNYLRNEKEKDSVELRISAETN